MYEVLILGKNAADLLAREDAEKEKVRVEVTSDAGHCLKCSKFSGILHVIIHLRASLLVLEAHIVTL